MKTFKRARPRLHKGKEDLSCVSKLRDGICREKVRLSHFDLFVLIRGIQKQVKGLLTYACRFPG